MEGDKKVMALFDVDGTLTPARDWMKPNMEECLKAV